MEIKHHISSMSSRGRERQVWQQGSREALTVATALARLWA